MRPVRNRRGQEFGIRGPDPVVNRLPALLHRPSREAEFFGRFLARFAYQRVLEKPLFCPGKVEARPIVNK
jgi:hypothetical protein